jgi:hypothetical protein
MLHHQGYKPKEPHHHPEDRHLDLTAQEEVTQEEEEEDRKVFHMVSQALEEDQDQMALMDQEVMDHHHLLVMDPHHLLVMDHKIHLVMDLEEAHEEVHHRRHRRHRHHHLHHQMEIKVMDNPGKDLGLDQMPMKKIWMKQWVIMYH